MGHTRKSTGGQHTAENAHPHVVGDYVQTHNGIIEAIWPLCTKYGIEHGKIHVDSIGLAHLIRKVGPKVILDEYKGKAALAFTYMNKPEALYLYHGASREKQEGDLIEERPLFILLQPEGIYYSSLRTSLDAINSDKETYKPFILKHNVVYEVIEGEFTTRKIVIDREYNNVVVSKINKITKYNARNAKPTQSMVLPGLQKFQDSVNANDEDPLLSETLPWQWQLKIPNKVYYHQGKYSYLALYKKGILTEGETYGSILDGIYIIDRNGFVIHKDPKGPIEPNQHVYYFINGAMIRSEKEYNHMKVSNISGLTEYTFKELSHKSVYPIFFRKANGAGTNLWYHNGGIVSKQTFTPKFSTTSYKLRYGRTKQIYNEPAKEAQALHAV